MFILWVFTGIEPSRGTVVKPFLVITLQTVVYRLISLVEIAEVHRYFQRLPLHYKINCNLQNIFSFLIFIILCYSRELHGFWMTTPAHTRADADQVTNVDSLTEHLLYTLIVIYCYVVVISIWRLRKRRISAPAVIPSRAD